MYKILIIEDEILVALGLKNLLEHNGYKVCGLATNYKDAKRLLSSEVPDLILCDIHLNEEKTGIDIMVEFRHNSTGPFIFITANSDMEAIQSAYTLNASNFIIKPYNDQQVLVAVQSAILSIEKRDEGTLTDREHAVLRLIAEGYNTKEAAQVLNISFNTVETHRKKMMKRFNVKTMAQLIHIATGKGWI